MFKTAELGRKVPKAEFRELAPILRQELLEVQQELRLSNRFPVIILFAGVDGAGKSEMINLMNEWMDPRWLVTCAYGEPSDEERERPEFWRFWRDLPPRGRIGLFLSAWYHRPLIDRVYERIDEITFFRRLERIVSMGDMLMDDGALIIKFWMHLSRDEQRIRLKSLEKDPLTRWRVHARDWEHWKLYDRFVESAEQIIRHTSTGRSSWNIVEGKDPCYRALTVGTIIRDAIRYHLGGHNLHEQLQNELANRGDELQHNPVPTISTVAATISQNSTPLTVLSQLDMSRRLSKRNYSKKLRTYQSRLNQLQRQANEHGISTILVLEGPDAAGKGGAIRRITAALDARHYLVRPIAAPTDEERQHHYLWRFWRFLSRAGRVTIFDRSWYGRVLVERVEGFANEEEWRRAYGEINDFEDHLLEHGIVLAKFWLHITKEEQLARFEDRQQTPYKRWKLTDEDWRNRERWEDYELAVNDMLAYTNTRRSAWTLVEGNDKRYARIKILKTVCEQLEARLAADCPPSQ